MNWRSHRTWISLTLLTTGLIVAGGIAVRQRDVLPLYQGHTARYWMRHLSNPNPQLRMNAFAAFTQTNSECIPFLMSAFKGEKTVWDETVEWISRKVGPKLPSRLQNWLPPAGFSETEASLLVLNSLSITGPRAREANPVLIQALTSRDRRLSENAFLLLQATGADDPKVAPALEKILMRISTRIRLSVAQFLWRLNRNKTAVLPVALEALENSDPAQFWSAATMLPGLLPESSVAIPTLVNTLNRTNRDNRLRGKTAITLGQMGSLAEAAIPALTQATNDFYSNVREAASEALRKILRKGIRSE